MEEQKVILVKDESSDRKYFSIVPNYVLDNYDSTGQALYMHMKRLAGEKGTAYPSLGFLTKKLGATKHTVQKYMKILLQDGLIEYVGEKIVQTAGGLQKVKEYRISDIWKRNVDFYFDNKGGQKDTPLESKGGQNSIQRGGKIVQKGGQNSTPNKNNTKNNTKEEPTGLFLEFWKEYPPTRKQDRDKCFKEWAKYSEIEQRAIYEDVLKRKTEHQDWIKEKQKFVPAPLVYLRNKRWEAPINKAEEPEVDVLLIIN